MARDPISGKKNKNARKFILFGEKAKIMVAPEPSSVVWENLEVDKKETRKRYSIVLTVILVFILVTFLSFTAMKHLAGQNKLVYPASTDCADIRHNFEVNGVIDQ